MKHLIVVGACSFVFLASGASTIEAYMNSAPKNQQTQKTITKSNLLTTLRDEKEKVKVEAYTSLIEKYGVDFEMSEADEKEIREAASFFTSTEKAELIAVIRSSFIGRRGKREIYLPAEDRVPIYISSLNLAVKFDSFKDFRYSSGVFPVLPAEGLGRFYYKKGVLPCIFYYSADDSKKIDAEIIEGVSSLYNCYADSKGTVSDIPQGYDFHRCRRVETAFPGTQDITLRGYGTIRVEVKKPTETENAIKSFALVIEKIN